MRYLKCLLLIAASLTLFACGPATNSTTGTGVISLKGGDGTSGSGGKGGAIVTMKNFTSAAMLIPGSATMTNFSSAVHGDLKFHVGGGVVATFSVPGISPEFGNVSTATTVAATINSPNPTQVALDPAAPADNSYFILTGDPDLYFQTPSGRKRVTGLTVNTTLRLPSNTVPTLISQGIVINGTLTNTTDGEAINLQSGTFIQVNGRVTTNSFLRTNQTGTGAAGGDITLTASGASGGTLINLGTIDASGTDGTGVPGGASGAVTLLAANFLYNTNTINARGGKSDTGAGGLGGAIQLKADAASIATSGTIDSSGGNGTSGGAAGLIMLSGGKASAIGRVSVEGTVNANGGNCTSGSSGAGGNAKAVSLTSFSGGILIAATISANGGNGVGGNGGAGGSLLMKNMVGTDSTGLHLVSPEGIKVSGNISLNGGNGTAGGTGGAIAVASDVAGNALQGFANVEFFGYQSLTLNGGASASGNGGNGGTVLAILSSPVQIVGVDIPGGGVYNEVTLTARGGDNTTKSAAGGNGGALQFVTPQAGNTVDPLRTLVSASGSIDISGGAGTIGGAGGTAEVSGYGNVTCSGAINANGGAGTTQGGAGSTSITLFSSSSVSVGGIAVVGGSGNQGGNGGNVAVTAGNQTSTGFISANGGNSGTAPNGGNGGTVTLLSEYALTVRNVVNVARGAGGTGISANNATNGTVVVDGVTLATALPASGAI
ncbi:MAG TPA: hypothetical protein VI298_17805 [Geobacteraceae bacterium]